MGMRRATLKLTANAILDGTDAVMLSRETAIGRHPVQTVKAMAKIIAETEKVLPYELILLDYRLLVCIITHLPSGQVFNHTQ